MQLCEEYHQEVCFDGRNCPVCEAINEKEDIEHKLEKVESELETSNEEIDNLRSQIQDLKDAALENIGSPTT